MCCNKIGLNKTSLKKQLKCNISLTQKKQLTLYLLFMVGINLSLVTKLIKTKY